MEERKSVRYGETNWESFSDLQLEVKESARPRRLSEVNIVKKTRPIPKGSAFFIFSYKNRYAIWNGAWLQKRDKQWSIRFLTLTRQLWYFRAIPQTFGPSRVSSCSRVVLELKINVCGVQLQMMLKAVVWAHGRGVCPRSKIPQRNCLFPQRRPSSFFHPQTGEMR